MAKINVLEKHVAELIAAGEVVERPSSVIKELVENSIDSGATSIVIEIQNGGKTFMRVTDNGCGIENDDIRNAFLRHATSKIKYKSDLDSISTLGFRGEALASISSVARVELITRTENEEFGTKYVICGGEEKEFEQAGCANGTTFIVKDLFFNTPARLKFLKKDATESNAVITMIELISLSHPEISFKVIKDGKQVLLTPGDYLQKSAIFSVYGKEFSDCLVPIDYELNGVKVTGFASKPTASRKNKKMQLFFLNGRYIRTKTGYKALEQAYKNQIMTGVYPACVLNIEIKPDEVDVNVHPSKIEVRFSNESKIFSAVYYAVKSGLQADVSRVQFKTDVTKLVEDNSSKQLRFDIPDSSLKKSRKTVEKAFISQNQNDIIKPQTSFFQNMNASSFREEFNTFDKKADNADIDILVEENDFLPNENEKSEKIVQESVVESNHKTEERIEFKYIGQAFDTYIIVEVDSKMVLIDKHAAHERILFEKIKKEAKSNPQMLLVPVQIPLSSDEYDAIISNIDAINSCGFELEDYGGKTILARSVPMELDMQDVKDLVVEMAGKLDVRAADFTPDFLDWLYHSVACRAAIKAGNKSTVNELTALADVVLNDENIRYCPHGRPICAEMSLYEIKKRFSRIV